MLCVKIYSRSSNSYQGLCIHTLCNTPSLVRPQATSLITRNNGVKAGFLVPDHLWPIKNVKNTISLQLIPTVEKTMFVNIHVSVQEIAFILAFLGQNGHVTFKMRRRSLNSDYSYQPSAFCCPQRWDRRREIGGGCLYQIDLCLLSDVCRRVVSWIAPAEMYSQENVC